MSHIPNSAIPHAGPETDAESPAIGTDSRFGQLSELGSGIVDKVREYPKTAAVAGAAVVGLAAAAAYPAIRGRGRGEERSGSRKQKS
jgi:hypothetical protein